MGACVAQTKFVDVAPVGVPPAVQLKANSPFSRNFIRFASRLLGPDAKSALGTECLDSLAPDEFARTVASAVERLPPLQMLDLRAKLDFAERLDYERDEIYLTMASPAEYPRRLACQKEPWTVKWIEEFVKPSHVLYDIGANVGAYSLVAAKRTRGQARIFAFEPAFPNFPQLCRNILLNGCQNSIVPLPFALGGTSRLEYFNYADLQHGSALHTLGEQLDYKGQPFTPLYRQPMLTYAIDDLLDTFHLPVPHHVKIDVDGTEMDVLRGATKTLTHPEMTTIMIEICDLRCPAAHISEFLGPKGWRLTERHDRQDAQGRSQNVSYLQYVKGI